VGNHIERVWLRFVETLPAWAALLVASFLIELRFPQVLVPAQGAAQHLEMTHAQKTHAMQTN
jgi:hypothetical protein